MNFRQLIIKLIVPVFIIYTVVGCNNSGNSKNKEGKMSKDSIPVSNKDFSIPGNFSTQTSITFDSIQVKKFLDSFVHFKSFTKEIESFYHSRNFAYAWFDEKGLIEPAHNLYNRIKNISEEGIPDELPYKEKFTELMEERQDRTIPSPELELMLTSQYLLYAKNVWQGLNEKQIQSMQWLLPRKKISYRQLLDSLAGGGALNNEPVYRQYHLLKAYLKKYNGIKLKNSMPIIKTDKKKLQQGDTAAVVSDIRQWLYEMGDIASNDQSPVFDSTLSNAVMSFQSRLGIKEDGIVGPSVVREMNYPLEKRIETIMVNMERTRWVPVNLQKNYLLVNIPGYKLYVLENDSIAFSMNVVVGKSQHKTVIFNGEIKYVVFSPYWNIPASIIKNEIRPAMRRNRNYLARHNMEWNGGNIRQKPGPNNSLGLVKFLFPNSHSIYLHDTPAKSLFGEDNRAFSHGCIRISDPKRLALYLLRSDTAWNETSVTGAMNRGVEQTIFLKKTVPVFITYFTAWADRAGKINFRKDVYNRDSRLAKLILDKPSI